MKAQKVLTVVLSVILWLVVILAAFFAFTTLATRDSNNVANLGGFTPLTVETDSMAPTFKAGDMIIIKRCDTSTLKEGDIITFHTIIENRYVLNTHRIVSIEDYGSYRSYVTKGDNNQISDSKFVSDGDVVGKFVLKLAGVGKLMTFMASSVGFFLVIVLPLLIFFVYQLYHLIVVSAKLKKAIAEEAAAGINTEAEAKAKDAEIKAKEAADKAKEAEEKLAELEKLKAEYEAKIAEAEKLKDSAKDE